MKRAGQLMAAIANRENLLVAFWKAAKGKRAKPDCRLFQANLDGHLDQLQADLLAGQAPVGNYHFFTIHDPKERHICAASFPERVLHHALMNLCEPVLEKAAIYDSYACRKGKGRLAAITRALGYARKYGWYLKLDIRKYFDSIDHAILRRLLYQRFKDPTSQPAGFLFAIFAIFAVKSTLRLNEETTTKNAENTKNKNASCWLSLFSLSSLSSLRLNY